MDWQLIFNFAVPLVGGVLTLIVLPWLRSIRDDATRALSEAAQTQKALNDFRLEVATTYVTHTDVQDIKNMLTKMGDKLENWMQHINERLDRKQDR